MQDCKDMGDYQQQKRQQEKKNMNYIVHNLFSKQIVMQIYNNLLSMANRNAQQLAINRNVVGKYQFTIV